jgi:hypothetical protein
MNGLYLATFWGFNFSTNIDLITSWSGTGTTTFGGVDEIARSRQRKDSPEKLSVSSQCSVSEIPPPLSNFHLHLGREQSPLLQLHARKPLSLSQIFFFVTCHCENENI